MNDFAYEKRVLLSHISNTDIIEIFKKNKCFIAGGAITSIFSGKDINDVDVYFRDYESLVIVLKNLFNSDELEEKDFFDLSSFSLVYTNMTKKSILFTKDGLNIQLIYFKFFNTPKEIFDTFDFTINMGCYDCANGEFVLHEEFLRDIAQRRLAVNTNTSFPIISLLRVDKYKMRGYKISRKDFINLCLAVNKLNLNTWEEMTDAIGGMYGYTYTELFDTNKPFSLEESMNQLSKLEVNLDTYKSELANADYYVVIDKINKNLKRKPTPESRIFYKKVLRTSVPGTYHSYHRKEFHYIIGQTVDGGTMGIWVYNTTRKANNHFVNTDKSKEAILLVRATEDACVVKDSGCFRIIGKTEVVEEIPIDKNEIDESHF